MCENNSKHAASHSTSITLAGGNIKTYQGYSKYNSNSNNEVSIEFDRKEVVAPLPKLESKFSFPKKMINHVSLYYSTSKGLQLEAGSVVQWNHYIPWNSFSCVFYAVFNVTPRKELTETEN